MILPDSVRQNGPWLKQNARISPWAQIFLSVYSEFSLFPVTFGDMAADGFPGSPKDSGVVCKAETQQHIRDHVGW